MGLEAADFIADLDQTWPTGLDPLNKGDDHIRLIKQVLKDQFPGSTGEGYNEVILAQEADLNNCTGSLGNFQEQINSNQGDIADRILRVGDSMTGALEGVTPTNDADLTRKDYVDSQVQSLADFLILTGGILMWPTAVAPVNWLLCDGSARDRDSFSNLFAVIGITYGNGDGSTTFNLPDYRGQFLRGTDSGAGNDPNANSRTDRGDGTNGDNVGTKQVDDLKSHNHEIRWYDQNYVGGNVNRPFDQLGNILDGSGTEDTGGDETRPINININFIIRT